MSGGSMDYLYLRVLQDATFNEDTWSRKTFREHLGRVAEALKAIEWVDSGDSGCDVEEKAIAACFFHFRQWQPMETAPKDRKILLVDAKATVFIGQYHDDMHAVHPRPYWERDGHLGVWHSRSFPPIAWMPLPSPPTDEVK